jgi:protein-S-isoprenylcysteine O-methyltransferase Ste14
VLQDRHRAEEPETWIATRERRANRDEAFRSMTTPLPFTWPYALLFWPVYIWIFIPEFRVIGRATVKTTAPPEDRGSLRVVLAAGGLSITAAFVLSFVAQWATLPGHAAAWFSIGLSTMIAGSLLRRHCFRVLGSFFTGAVTIQSGQRVIDSGAYRWLRHPSYTAGMLIFCGIGLALGNGLSIAVPAIVNLAAYSYRARIEEQALLSSLGAEYARFMASRRRFIPFVY